MLRFIWGWELRTRHNSNQLHMSTGSRCWMCWMWYRYIPSACSVHQTLMHRTQKQAEILLVLVHGLCWTMSIMFSSSFTFCRTWHSARWFTLGKEPFSHRCWNTSVGDLSSRISWPIFFDSSSGVTIATPVHKIHIGVFFIGKWHVYSYCSLNSYHSTKWLLSLLSEALLAF
jgi:hypothetical protein